MYCCILHVNTNGDIYMQDYEHSVYKTAGHDLTKNIETFLTGSQRNLSNRR